MTVILRTRQKFGNAYLNICDVTLPASYVTGGMPVTAAQLGLDAIGSVLPGTASGYLTEFDHVNSRLRVIETHNTAFVPVDPPAISPGAVMNMTVTIPNITTTDRVVAIPPVDLEEDLVLQSATVSAANTVTLRLKNVQLIGNPRTFTISVHPPSIPANAVVNLPLGLPGVTATDRIVAFPPLAFENGLMLQSASVSAPGQITLRILNTTPAAVAGAAHMWTFLAFPDGGIIDGAARIWTFLTFSGQAREVSNATNLSAVTVRISAIGF